MAEPSSSHHRRERGERHQHHRTISSTTLLLVLSLILAVLAVMLSIPQGRGATSTNGDSSGVWNYLSPKRSQALVAREHAVAVREAEVARREADVLAGSAGGVSATTAATCPPCNIESSISPVVLADIPVQTIIKEVVKEFDSISPPSWWKDAGIRVEELLDRESHIAEREKDMGKREESIGRRETDASRREGWIMEQLIALGNEPGQMIEEEVIYDSPAGRRKPKGLPPIVTVTESIAPLTQTEIRIETETVTVPAAAPTRLAARPIPEEHIRTAGGGSTAAPTTAVEVVKEEFDLPDVKLAQEEVEEYDEYEEEYEDRRYPGERRVRVGRRPRQSMRPPRRWWW